MDNVNGVVVVDKPRGMTSHDVVGRLRRIYHTRRVGHTGTLDPMATGVLPVCIGCATKAAEMLTAKEKRYTAVLELGKRSDTLDIEGEILQTHAVEVTEIEVRKVIAGFVGRQQQLPPMYSAIKQNGKKLYELARQGIEVERQKRDITIYAIDVLSVQLPYVKIDVSCSKGTYIRSLCDDIGTRLGCGAVMTELRRTLSGFGIEEAHTIEELESMEQPENAVLATDSLFADLPQIRLNEKQERSIRNGVRMTWRGGIEDEKYRLYGADDTFLCVSQLRDSKLILIKSFWT